MLLRTCIINTVYTQTNRPVHVSACTDMHVWVSGTAILISYSLLYNCCHDNDCFKRVPPVDFLLNARGLEANRVNRFIKHNMRSCVYVCNYRRVVTRNTNRTAGFHLHCNLFVCWVGLHYCHQRQAVAKITRLTMMTSFLVLSYFVLIITEFVVMTDTSSLDCFCQDHFTLWLRSKELGGGGLTTCTRDQQSFLKATST